MFLTDSMRLKISFHIIFSVPVTGIFVRLKLDDKEVYVMHTKILETILFGVDGRRGTS